MKYVLREIHTVYLDFEIEVSDEELAENNINPYDDIEISSFIMENSDKFKKEFTEWWVSAQNQNFEVRIGKLERGTSEEDAAIALEIREKGGKSRGEAKIEGKRTKRNTAGLLLEGWEESTNLYGQHAANACSAGGEKRETAKGNRRLQEAESGTESEVAAVAVLGRYRVVLEVSTRKTA